MTTDNGIELHPVTADRDLMWDLVRRWEAGEDVVAHAHSLGLYPPGYEEDVRYDVELVYPTADATDDDAVFVWSTSRFGSDEPADGDDGETEPALRAPSGSPEGSTQPPPF